MRRRVAWVVLLVVAQACRCNPGGGYWVRSGNDDDSLEEPLTADAQRFAPLLELSNQMTAMIVAGQIRVFYKTKAAASLKKLATVEEVEKLYAHVLLEVGSAQSFKPGQWSFRVQKSAAGSFTTSTKVVTHQGGSMYYTFTFADEHAAEVIGLHFKRRKAGVPDDPGAPKTNPTTVVGPQSDLPDVSEPITPRCRDRLARLEAQLASIDVDDMSRFADPVDVATAPVMRTGQRFVALGPVVSVRDDRVFVDGRYIGDVDGESTHDLLRSELNTSERNRQILHPADTTIPFLYLFASPTLDARKVLSVVSKAPLAFEIRLMVRDPEPSLDPVPADASVELRARVTEIIGTPESSAQFKKSLNLLTESFGTCAPLHQLMARAFRVDDSSRRWPIALEGTAQAVLQCQCHSVDMDALEASMLLINVGTQPKLGWMTVSPAQPDAKQREVVALRRGDTIADLVAKLARAERTTRASAAKRPGSPTSAIEVGWVTRQTR